MTAVLQRIEPTESQPESARAHVANAIMVIDGYRSCAGIAPDEAIAAIERRLRLALQHIDAEGSEGAQRMYEAATSALAAVREERDSLRDELRDHQALLAELQPVPGEHLLFDMPTRRFTIEKRFRRVLGEYTDERLAMAHLKKLRAAAAAKATTTPTAAPADAEVKGNG